MMVYALLIMYAYVLQMISGSTLASSGTSRRPRSCRTTPAGARAVLGEPHADRTGSKGLTGFLPLKQPAVVKTGRRAYLTPRLQLVSKAVAVPCWTTMESH